MTGRLKRLILILVILIICVLTMLYFAFPDWFHSQNVKEPEVSKGRFGERVLVIAPHPDDETLGGGGVIIKQIQAHKQVKVVVMTSGDGYRKAVQEQFHIEKPLAADFRKLGYVRHEESLQAMKTLGMSASDVIFLGYPDGGVNGLWQENWDYSHLHKALNGYTYSPYPFAFEKNAPYCGANVVKNLIQIIRDYKPTDIVYPDPNDVHHDHWATQAFVKYTLTWMQYKTNEWTYLVHRYDWPIPWAYKPDFELNPPYTLQNTGTNWMDLPLTEQEEHLKLQAIQQYHSQERVMEPFLEAFVRRNDLLGTYPKHTIAAVTQSPDFNTKGELPYLLIQDPVGDTFSRKLHGSADIQAVGVVHSPKMLSIALETNHAISNDVSYIIRFRLFHRNQMVTRDDIEVLNGRIKETPKAANSKPYAEHASVTQFGNRLVINMPLPADWDNVYSMMLGVDTHDQTLIDKSAWENGEIVLP